MKNDFIILFSHRNHCIHAVAITSFHVKNYQIIAGDIFSNEKQKFHETVAVQNAVVIYQLYLDDDDNERSLILIIFLLPSCCAVSKFPCSRAETKNFSPRPRLYIYKLQQIKSSAVNLSLQTYLYRSVFKEFNAVHSRNMYKKSTRTSEKFSPRK